MNLDKCFGMPGTYEEVHCVYFYPLKLLLITYSLPKTGLQRLLDECVQMNCLCYFLNAIRRICFK